MPNELRSTRGGIRTPQYEEAAITSLRRIDDARPEWRTAAVLDARAMTAIAANCTNPKITTGHRAPATTPTHTRAGGLSPLLTQSAAAKIPRVVISHPHKYTVITGIAPSYKLDNESAQSPLVLTLARLTSADTPNRQSLTRIHLATGRRSPRQAPNPSKIWWAVAANESNPMYARYELRADCTRVIGQTTRLRKAQPLREQDGNRRFLLLNGPVDRAAGSFYGPVAGPPGGCLQSAAIPTHNRHSVCHSAHRIVETHRLGGDCPINGGSDGIG